MTRMYTNDQTLGFKYIDLKRYESIDEKRFKIIQCKDEPAILANCSFGNCTQTWDLDYLSNKLCNDQIIIHDSSDPNLDFLKKNFQYKTCLFSEFAEKLRSKDPTSYVYLRSTSKIARGKKPTRIEEDFPQLASDLQPPTFIPFGNENNLYHSSVLRLASSNVQVWTHFDLYDNVLCQVVGTKRVVLLPPDEIKNLYIEGDKSPVNNFDNQEDCLKKFPLIKDAKLYRCLLKPGEVLYIPALWWHNIRTISEEDCDRGYSIGFNLFWRDTVLEASNQYAERDVYGNKNLPLYDAALANLDKALNHLDKLPSKFKDFYKVMLFEKMRSKIFSAQTQ